ncbi:MAG: GNAT family N-acetyltransferase [Lachnospiraceae bacterium]|nr:GNAT family N-acetyltransferase [Lachnospiraceae bacterium]
MNVFVRKMTPDDIPEVRKLYIIGWQNAFKGIVPQDYLDQMNLDGWAPPLDGAYVLTDGEKVLGTSSISGARDKAFDGWGEIISVYVLPELIGQGYGHVLFTFALGELLSLGFDRIYLTVFEDNLRARTFYEKHGFHWNGQRLSMTVGGKDLTELRYVYPETQ